MEAALPVPARFAEFVRPIEPMRSIELLSDRLESPKSPQSSTPGACSATLPRISDFNFIPRHLLVCCLCSYQQQITLTSVTGSLKRYHHCLPLCIPEAELELSAFDVPSVASCSDQHQYCGDTWLRLRCDTADLQFQLPPWKRRDNSKCLCDDQTRLGRRPAAPFIATTSSRAFSYPKPTGPNPSFAQAA